MPSHDSLSRMKEIVLAGLFALSILAASMWGPRSKDAPPAAEARIEGLSSDRLAGFRLSEQYARRGSTVYELSRGSEVLKVEVLQDVAKESAALLAEEGILGIQALYANALSPYPGDISDEIVCPENLRPRFFRPEGGAGFEYCILFANDRLAYGARTEDAVKHKSLVGWIYCEPGRQLLKVKCFAPPGSPDRLLEEMFRSFSCEGD